MDPNAANINIIQQLLRRYQSVALGSISGPTSFPALPWSAAATVKQAQLSNAPNLLAAALQRFQTKNIPFQPPPSQFLPQAAAAVPVITTSPPSRQANPELTPTETILEGETIACFNIGGERRLCLPQILATVLRDFELNEINAACEKLHVHCARCTAPQLAVFKHANILHQGAPSCGLITKTDAERTCGLLLHSEADGTCDEITADAVDVYHECFGKCKGVFIPELYTESDANCIMCSVCEGAFCPRRFVGHSHDNGESMTCHWGFDSHNWRSYLLAGQSQRNEGIDHGNILESMKEKYASPSQRARLESRRVPQTAVAEPIAPETKEEHIPDHRWESISPPDDRRSVTPPLLQDPTQVVPLDSQNSLTLAPNVELAPQTKRTAVPRLSAKLCERIERTVSRKRVDSETLRDPLLSYGAVPPKCAKLSASPKPSVNIETQSDDDVVLCDDEEASTKVEAEPTSNPLEFEPLNAFILHQLRDGVAASPDVTARRIAEHVVDSSRRAAERCGAELVEARQRVAKLEEKHRAEMNSMRHSYQLELAHAEKRLEAMLGVLKLHSNATTAAASSSSTTAEDNNNNKHTTDYQRMLVETLVGVACQKLQNPPATKLPTDSFAQLAENGLRTPLRQ